MNTDDARHIRTQRKGQLSRVVELLDRPPLAGDEPDDGDLSRRRFMQLMGASVGLAGLAGCTRAPEREILPYSVEPRGVTPGVPRSYATTSTLDGYGTGLLVESHEGRPTKVEGNPDHPASLGATGPMEQALVLGLYDPDRPRSVIERAQPSRWETFANTHARVLGRNQKGQGIHFLLQPTSSPTRVDLIERIRSRLPDCAFHFYVPFPRTQVWLGARAAYGQVVEPRFDLSRADVIVSLGSDFASGWGPASLVLARQLADGRRLRLSTDDMNRLYVVEPAQSVTGSVADQRLPLRERELPAFAAALAARVFAARGRPEASHLSRWANSSVSHAAWLDALVRDLLAHEGASAVVVGDAQPPEVHVLAHAINQALGNLGRTVTLAPSPIYEAGGASHGLAALTSALEAGEVETLVILGGNPVYDAFDDLDLSKAVRRAATSVYAGPYANETATSVDWFVPETHVLESWGDARAFDGTVSIVQPLIAPLFDGHSIDEVLAVFLGFGSATPVAHDLVRSYWSRAHATRADAVWEETVRRGALSDSTAATLTLDTRRELIADVTSRLDAAPQGDAIEVRFAPDPRIYDGRFANNAWLLELPEPVTQVTWDNVALMSPATMTRLGLSNEDVVELSDRGRSVRLPALRAHGHADQSITVWLGWGRRGGESLASGLGGNGYLLRTSIAPLGSDLVKLRKTGETYELAMAQLEFDLHGRDDDVLLRRTLAEYRRTPGFATDKNTRPPHLYASAPSAKRQWGMSIDLNSCTGCSACVVACQAENNVPVVGKEGVRKGRRMHWLRIDRYVGESDQLGPEPMLCQHCETAPCEYVCPVNATVHSSDGLNQMVYNRCVGTRFCSNNCPYKVRRFNFFNYTADVPAVTRLVYNPDVTVRDRGVMEKCSFCVQRIREAELHASVDGRELVPGEVRTACQQACPTQAIVFGDIADGSSDVARLQRNERTFAVLHDLGTVPRTRYLARVTNPNPELA